MLSRARENAFSEHVKSISVSPMFAAFSANPAVALFAFAPMLHVLKQKARHQAGLMS